MSQSGAETPSAIMRPALGSAALGLVKPILAFGISGHRTLDNPQAVQARITEALVEISASAEAMLANLTTRLGLADESLQLRLYSPLAEGTDRLAAEAALALGARLQCPLPFPRTEYAKDFETPESKADFRALLAKAERVFELDGEADHRDIAYLEAGRLVVRHCDVLIAVWDGERARGTGGTAEVVAEARASGRPVVWIRPDGKAAGLLVGPAHAPVRVPLAALDEALHALIAPPGKQQINSGPGFAGYVRETRPRIPSHWFDTFVNVMLLRLRWPSFGGRDALERSGDFWTAPFKNYTGLHGVCAPCLEQDAMLAFARADMFATHYAGLYRSTFLFNFGLSALAVGIAIFNRGQNRLVGGIELLAIAAIIALTLVANRQQWHQRWIEYRRLAEQIRPLRVLFPLGLTLSTPGTASAEGEAPSSWTDWLTRRVERHLGLPNVAITPEYLYEVRTFAAREVLEEQIGYHERNAKKLARVDERLHWLGLSLFALTFLACLFDIVEFSKLASSDHQMADWLAHKQWIIIALTGVLPAVGSAILGIRNVGEFARLELRSNAMASGLKRRRVALEAVPSAPITRAELSAQIESFAAELTAETAEWRTLIAVRRIELPG